MRESAYVEVLPLKKTGLVTVESYVLRWEVPVNKSDGAIAVEHGISSPTFIFGKRARQTWKMYLCHRRNEDNTVIIMNCEENVRKSKNEDCEVEIGAKIRFSEKELQEQVCLNDMFWIENNASFFNTRVLNSRKLAVDGVITIFGHVFIKYTEKDPECVEDELSMLGVHMKKLWTNIQFTDVILRTPTKHFKAHKFVLSARSPVFAGILAAQEFKEGEGSLMINDVDEGAVEAFLEYIYTGTISVSKNSPGFVDTHRGLLLLSSTFQLPGLKKICDRTVFCSGKL